MLEKCMPVPFVTCYQSHVTIISDVFPNLITKSDHLSLRNRLKDESRYLRKKSEPHLSSLSMFLFPPLQATPIRSLIRLAQPLTAWHVFSSWSLHDGLGQSELSPFPAGAQSAAHMVFIRA